MDLDALTVRTEDLSEVQRADIIRICIQAHDNEAFNGLFTFIPSGGRHFLAYDDSELISHAVVTTRWVQPEGGRVLKTAFVDAVSTTPHRQGEGFGSAVMRQMARAVSDYEIGCLQTDRAGFYQRLGWELWLGPLGGRDGDRTIPTPDQRGVMILRLPTTPEVDVTRELMIECQPSRIWE